MDDILRKRLYETIPGVESELTAIERTGRLPPLYVSLTWGAAGRSLKPPVPLSEFPSCWESVPTCSRRRGSGGRFAFM
jgi:hypothetical protein